MKPTTTANPRCEVFDNYIYSLIIQNKLKTFSISEFAKSLSVEQKKELENLYTKTYESLWPFFTNQEKSRLTFLRLRDAGKLKIEKNYNLFTKL